MAGEESIASGMAGRYATALFELALSDDSLEKVEDDLSRFRAMLDESSDLDRLVHSPVISAGDQARALSAVLARAEIGGLTANFFKLVARNRRLFAIRDMIKAFAALAAAHRGEMTAEVTSATQLTGEQEEALREALKAAVGKDVQFNTTVDASLIGGIIVKMGSRMIDNSLKTKLNNLKFAMKEVG